MIDIVIEVLVNLFQAGMFIGFLYLFFDKPKNRLFNAAGLIGFVLLLFVTLNIFTLCIGYVQFIDVFIYVLIMEIYTLIFLKGSLLVKVIMPIVYMLINTIISILFGYLVSFVTGVSFEFLISQYSVYRYFCIAIINITNFLVLFVLLKIHKKRLTITKWADTAAFVIIPFTTMFVIHCTFFVLTKTNFRSDIMIFLVLICVSMITVSVIMWLLLERISKDNEIKSKLLLGEQREQLYKENVLQTNIQIEKMSKIKHDTKNDLLCIQKLVSDGKLEDAQNICSDVLSNLSGIYTPLSTENPLLNAIVNVEQEKAVSYKIEFVTVIKDELKELSDTSDVVSLIGNLCDNAIEYLSSVPEEDRKMSLEISAHNRYKIITCRNKILKSVLDENPTLESSKEDSDVHGKGIEILQDTAQKYDGDIRIYEDGGYFCSSVIIKAPNLPESN